jgi:hypothetical protein
MNIRELFVKPIDRPINGVIKADQRDAESIWQELDEYVVTKQLTEYLRRSSTPTWRPWPTTRTTRPFTARMAVWVSGFFGSGKSHFIKILSYLLENIEAVNPKDGETKRRRRSSSTNTRSRTPCCSPMSSARCRAAPM